jgi:hypothetical protein
MFDCRLPDLISSLLKNAGIFHFNPSHAKLQRTQFDGISDGIRGLMQEACLIPSAAEREYVEISGTVRWGTGCRGADMSVTRLTGAGF